MKIEQKGLYKCDHCDKWVNQVYSTRIGWLCPKCEEKVVVEEEV